MTSKPTVVIADDHPEMLEAVSHLLQEEFDIVSTVQDGVSALQVATELKPAVVILDISMPKMGGIEVAQELIFTLSFFLISVWLNPYPSSPVKN